MNCLFCRKGPAQGISLYRVNPKGQKGVWACAAHVSRTDAKVDPDIRQFVDDLRAKRTSDEGEEA